ncbi:MAG: hypothetical protein U1F67_00900 [Rubrivivax sp.]
MDTDAGPVHLSAASGMVRIGQRLYVIADDDNQLAVFDLGHRGQGPSGACSPVNCPPRPKRARRQARPRGAGTVAGFHRLSARALLALGSGSRPNRQRAALLALHEQGGIDGDARELDFAPIHALLQSRFAQLNIEGAFVNGTRFCLLQRGNAATPDNALVEYDCAAILDWLRGGAAAPPPLAVHPYDLGELEGVPLCFTDGAALPGGGWVYCAVAEATRDNYADGPCQGSAVGIVAADGRPGPRWPLTPRCKTEGIAASIDQGRLELLLVTDADDPGTPAQLLRAELATPLL